VLGALRKGFLVHLVQVVQRGLQISLLQLQLLAPRLVICQFCLKGETMPFQLLSLAGQRLQLLAYTFQLAQLPFRHRRLD
jgi:hypothetical protein